MAEKLETRTKHSRPTVRGLILQPGEDRRSWSLRALAPRDPSQVPLYARALRRVAKTPDQRGDRPAHPDR
jgi:hypothetical protein